MRSVVIPSTMGDLPNIYRLFEEAITFQKKNNYPGWNSYDKQFIIEDIRQEHLFKITNGNDLLCIFSICYHDPHIWREREKHDAIYLHRVITNRAFQGHKIFKNVMHWAIARAKEKNLKYVRLDTWAENQKIIDYYKSYGFNFIQNFITPNTPDLPLQNRNLEVALLEYSIPVAVNSIKINNLEKVNIHQELSMINKYWNQHIIGCANGELIKLAKGKGAINWHTHDDQDELFLLLKGRLTIQLKSKNIDLNPNDLFIVPRGVEHCPIAHGEVEFLLMGLEITSNKKGGQPEWAAEDQHIL